MLPFGEMFGPDGPAVANRHGEPSTQALKMRSFIFWLIGIDSPPRSHTADTIVHQQYTVSNELTLRQDRDHNRDSTGGKRPDHTDWSSIHGPCPPRRPAEEASHQHRRRARRGDGAAPRARAALSAHGRVAVFAACARRWNKTAHGALSRVHLTTR